jgi:hypothetical protein
VRIFIAGLVGSLLAWMLVQTVDGRFFHVPAELAALAAGGPSPELEAKLGAASRIVAFKNAAVMMGLAGAVVGVCCALCEVLSRGVGARGVGILAAALLVGAVCGAAGGAAAVWLSGLDALKAWDRTYRAMLVNAVNLGLLGLAAGAGLGLPAVRTGSMARTAVGGLAGGVLAGALFPFVAALVAIVAYLGDAEDAVPSGPSLRLFWIVLGSLTAAWLSHWSSKRPATSGQVPTAS